MGLESGGGGRGRVKARPKKSRRPKKSKRNSDLFGLLNANNVLKKRKNPNKSSSRKARPGDLKKPKRNSDLFGLLNPNDVLGTGKNPNKAGSRKANLGSTKKHSVSKPKGKAPKGRPAPKPKSKKGGGSKGGMGPYRGGSVGVSSNVSRDEARQMVQEENNNLIRELLQQAGAFKQDLKFDTNTANALFDRSKGDLNYIFNEANDYIGSRNNAIDGTYNKLKGDVGNIFSGLENTMQGTTNANRNAALQEQARLGLQKAGLGSFDEDANFARLQAQQQGAHAQANIGLQQSASSEIGNLLGSMSKASLASAMGRATNARQDAITEAQQSYRGNINSIRNDITNINKRTPQTVNELWESMKNNAFQQQMERENADFQNQMAINSFNLDVSKFNSANFWKKREHAAKVAEARKKRQLAQQKLATQQESKRLYNSIKDVLNPVEYLFG